MINQAKLLAKIKRLSTENDDVVVVWLYGSRATGTETKESDFDLAIAFKNFKLSTMDAFLRPNELAIDWAQLLNIPEEKLSLVDINKAPIYLAFNIVEYGEIIYQTPTSRAFTEQNRIYSQYEYQMIENSRNE
jgi:predicted nucleotidyltransferase